MHITSIPRLSTFVLLIAIATLAACGDGPSTIQDGLYVLDKQNTPGDPQFDGAVVFNRGALTATFYACSSFSQCPEAQRTKLATETITPEADWGTGCPTSSDRTELEIVTLGSASLTLGTRTFVKPVLVASCPAPNGWVSLHSQGQIPLGGCSSTEQGCISFIKR